ncbi:hypothetical protein ACHAWF_008621 [Thalassiosira exigua]
MMRSGAILSALMDKNPILARFLFLDKDGTINGDEEYGHNEGENLRQMLSIASIFLALALEPTEVRNNWIIMLYEAYSVSGALFLNGTWILYEWGSAKGYRGMEPMPMQIGPLNLSWQLC